MQLEALGRGRAPRARASCGCLTCQPTCASGGSERVPARIKLSGVKTCDGRRYFERGEVLLDPKDTPSGAQPATYLRAPC